MPIDSENNVVKGDFYCPRCKGKMIEKRPTNDKRVVVNKNHTVRLKCPCGYYEDRVMESSDFLD